MCSVESHPVGGNAVRDDDTIASGAGDDASDNLGAILINGQQGDNFIVTVDDRSDLGTPDTVKGGVGRDTLVVDEGDLVTTGGGADQIILETYSGVADGYDVVTITDFDGARDVLTLQGEALLLRPGFVGETGVSVQELDDQTGTMVLINGIRVARLIGAQGVSPDQIRMRIDNR